MPKNLSPRLLMCLLALSTPSGIVPRLWALDDGLLHNFGPDPDLRLLAENLAGTRAVLGGGSEFLLFDTETGETLRIDGSGEVLGFSGEWVFISDRDGGHRFCRIRGQPACQLFPRSSGSVQISFGWGGGWVIWHAMESANDVDLNGDGDTEDTVVSVRCLTTGEELRPSGRLFSIFGDILVIRVSEQDVEEDLDGDGKLESLSVLRTMNLTTRQELSSTLNGRAVDRVGDWLFVQSMGAWALNTVTGEARDLGAARFASEIFFDRDPISPFWRNLDFGNWAVTVGPDPIGLSVYNLDSGEATTLGMRGELPANRHGGVVPPIRTSRGEWLAVSYYPFPGHIPAHGDNRDLAFYNLNTREIFDSPLDFHGHHAIDTAASENVCVSGRHFAFFSYEDIPRPDGVGGYRLWVHDLEDLSARDLGIGQDHCIEWGGRLFFSGPTDSLRIHDFATGLTAELPLQFEGVLGGWLFVKDSPEGDLLGLDLERLPEFLSIHSLFLRGDCNDDGTVDISDAVFSLGSLFLGDRDPGCDDACDSNDDGTIDISDGIATLGALFLGNGSIPPPGPKDCGVDPTDDALGCTATISPCL